MHLISSLLKSFFVICCFAFSSEILAESKKIAVVDVQRILYLYSIQVPEDWVEINKLRKEISNNGGRQAEKRKKINALLKEKQKDLELNLQVWGQTILDYDIILHKQASQFSNSSIIDLTDAIADMVIRIAEEENSPSPWN